ncbi:MAG: hypothetical protein JKY34_06215 [Kordiimonadaceae bacterium]|nr:hypothetical protein [Kordiimonadaceae bacterium]PCJ37688.1 MAG: hypothetical protein COA75_02925 [Cellvibrionales bacterium]
MDYFEIRSHCYQYGHNQIGAKEAAPIMGVTVKTARNYLSGKTKPDPVRLKYLKAVTGQKLIPEDVALWWNPRTKTLCCDSGWSKGEAELLNLFYLAELRERAITLHKETIEKLKYEVKQLKGAAIESAPALPSNVIQFPTIEQDKRA